MLRGLDIPLAGTSVCRRSLLSLNQERMCKDIMLGLKPKPGGLHIERENEITTKSSASTDLLGFEFCLWHWGENIGTYTLSGLEVLVHVQNFKAFFFHFKIFGDPFSRRKGFKGFKVQHRGGNLKTIVALLEICHRESCLAAGEAFIITTVTTVVSMTTGPSKKFDFEETVWNFQ